MKIKHELREFYDNENNNGNDFYEPPENDEPHFHNSCAVCWLFEGFCSIRDSEAGQ